MDEPCDYKNLSEGLICYWPKEKEEEKENSNHVILFFRSHLENNKISSLIKSVIFIYKYSQ